jgi:alkanesulfonate monooxygenase SsuD/methylene tetrahydromethanopterin reductase-like flavin-dependent oxidoreductase (luciferase family)
VAGPLNLPRCPQGRPVLVQAGSSDTGRRFAARHADAVFTAHMTKATAQEFYADLKRLAAAEGRMQDPLPAWDLFWRNFSQLRINHDWLLISECADGSQL